VVAVPKIENDKDPQPRKEAPPEKASVLGTKLVCKGEISGEEDVVIYGAFTGNVSLKNHTLFVNPEAVVEAEVAAANVSLSGSLVGNIRASGKVFLSSTAKMRGDIVASKIVIWDGAQFRGTIRMEKAGS
jgi:cytoskeletal protein CcmA (bactofilin family)